MQLDVLQRRAVKIPNATNSVNTLSNEFRLIPDMSFTCNGVLTSLLLGVDVRTVTSRRSRYPEVQIWRKTRNVYLRQGKEEIQMAAGDFSPDGVLVYNLTSPIRFQSGDVLGVYQPRRSESVVRLYYNVIDTNKSNDSAPFTYRIRGENPSSQFAINKLTTVTGENIFLSPIIGKIHTTDVFPKYSVYWYILPYIHCTHLLHINTNQIGL